MEWDDAYGWIRAEGDRAGYQVGEIEVRRVRSWSANLVAQTDREPLWFKQNTGVTFEGPLLRMLAPVADGLIVEPLAVEDECGWILTPDRSPIMRDLVDQGVLQGEIDARMQESVRCWSALQVALVGRGDEAVALGVPRLGLDHALDYFDSAVEDAGSRVRGHYLALSADEVAQAKAHRDVLVAAVEKLGALGLPESLDHGDLHDGNVFSSGQVFDLGDATWAHPLTTQTVASQQVGDSLGDAEGLAWALPTVEPWSSYAPMSALADALPAGILVGCLNRYDSWARIPSIDEGSGWRAGLWLLRAVGLILS